MAVGLGNRMMTADALGPLTVDETVVTRHIKEQDPALFHSVSTSVISAISPGVVGRTGIETAELVIGAAEHAKPELVILIDALAARSCDRLGTTVQLSSCGICPGSGVGNRRYSIDRDTVGLPVITIGVPMVVDSSTLVYDVLERAGIENIPDELCSVLKNGESFFVCLRDSDSVAEKCASIIADALNIAFKNDGLS
jgi:spore protease